MADQLIDNSGLITGDCHNPDEIVCPEGFEWACCPDTTVEYPPGVPVGDVCTLTSLGGGTTLQIGYRFLEMAGDYMWCGNIGGNSQVLKLNPDRSVTLVRTITEVNRPNSICIIGDKVLVMDDEYPIPSLRVFSFDGTYLESWSLPSGYDYLVSNQTSQMTSDGTKVIIGIKSCRIGGIYQSMLVWYDYYGTILQTYTDINESDIGCVKISGDLLLCANQDGRTQQADPGDFNSFGAVGVRSAITGEFIRFADRGAYSFNNFSIGWGNDIIELKSPGLDSLFMVGQYPNGSREDSRYEYNKYRFIYDHNFNLLTMFDVATSDIVSITRPWYNNYIYAIPMFQKAHRYGNYIVEGNTSHSSTIPTEVHHSFGQVRLWKIEPLTGALTFVRVMSTTQPSTGDDGNIGVSSYIDKDNIWMFGSGGTSYTSYVKVCDLIWAS